MKKYHFLFRFSILILALIMISGCEKTNEPEDEDPVNESPYGAGINYEQEKSGYNSIPKDLSIVTIADQQVNIPSRVMLDDYIPPIGNQGKYGTCTAWASGYYTRTIMYARENRLTKNDLTDPSNVFSPKYLFLATENHDVNCNGSAPQYAFEAMQKKGIATMKEVPYTDMDCSQPLSASWNQNAAQYKIENFRVVDHTNVNKLKTYLTMGRPVQISCLLAKDFFETKDEVLYDGDYSGTMEQHGRHAMTLIGFDDSKGTGGAFRIVNSWSEKWGDGGYFWADYNFFTSKLCYYAYVIESDKGGLSDYMIDEKIINPSYRVNGRDLITIKSEDIKDPEGTDRDRVVTYNVYNRGSETVSASSDWNIVYYYYNAFNPENDYGVILYDYYTDDVGEENRGKNGDFDEVGVDMKKYGSFNWWNYVDVPAGYSVAKAVYSEDGYDYDFEYYYTMPNITGKYYLVMMADGFNDHNEQYEQNNYIFFTGPERKPLEIQNGVIKNGVVAKSGKNLSSHAGEMKESQPNAYSLEEIRSLIEYQKREGILDVMARSHGISKSNPNGVFKGKRVVRAKLEREM